MPIPGEQPDLNALPPESSPVNRRLATQHVREARDRLTSSGKTKPAFEYELLRQYAQNRISASLVILLLVATVGFMRPARAPVGHIHLTAGRPDAQTRRTQAAVCDRHAALRQW